MLFSVPRTLSSSSPSPSPNWTFLLLQVSARKSPPLGSLSGCCLQPALPCDTLMSIFLNGLEAPQGLGSCLLYSPSSPQHRTGTLDVHSKGSLTYNCTVSDAPSLIGLPSDLGPSVVYQMPVSASANRSCLHQEDMQVK
jgi:hypothetical protein